ncbi:MAG: hypothetical protein KDD38_02850 [Bdellovibrionales bacterium]|nr:hypothetical protein [Bdellovibrionales bacterium]
MDKEKFSLSDDGKNTAFAVDGIEALMNNGRDEVHLQVKSETYEADLSLKLSELQVLRDTYDWVPSPDKENTFNGVQKKDAPEIVVEYKSVKKTNWFSMGGQTETSTGKFRIGETYAGSSFEDVTTTFEGIDDTGKRPISNLFATSRLR